MYRGGGKTLNTSFLEFIGTKIFPVKRLVYEEIERKKVLETNVGEALLQEISMLKSLMEYWYIMTEYLRRGFHPIWEKAVRI